MTISSKYFDSLRKKPAGRSKQTPEVEASCDWPDCKRPAPHLAPKGRGREGEYFHFCVDHVREYNRSYNFFRGMSDDEAEKFQEGLATGHRPTWKMATNRRAGDTDTDQWGLAGRRRPNNLTGQFVAEDPFDLIKGGEEVAPEIAARERRKRMLPPMAKRSLAELGLDETADGEAIKSRFKELAKRHHPDSSGGQGSEEKLKAVIKAYNYLKKSGLC
jgi:curved DNA-binding protein CbpA